MDVEVTLPFMRTSEGYYQGFFLWLLMKKKKKKLAYNNYHSQKTSEVVSKASELHFHIQMEEH